MTKPATAQRASVEPDADYRAGGYRRAGGQVSVAGANRRLVADHRLVSVSAAQPGRGSVRRLLRARFTRRAWVDVGYAIISAPVGVAGFACMVVMSVHPLLLLVSTPVARGLGTVNRWLAGQILGEQVPPPPPMRTEPYVRAKSPDAARLATLASAEGGTVKLRRGRLEVAGVPASRVAELAASKQIAIEELKTHSGWLEAAARDRPGWRARAYLALKLPVSLLGLAAVGVSWVGGIMGLLAPIWLSPHHPIANPYKHIAIDGLLMLLGATALLAGPWLTELAVAADRALIRNLLGPSSMAERVRDLQESRARVVDDSAARLRSIERNLHDGAQAQLVGLAMKLGLAKEKLGGSTDAGLAPIDLDRAVELVDAAHRSAIEAITELRTLARGIHPPVLDNGLTDALATLAARSAVPVELIADVGERPSAAIETIAYFCAAELLANVAKHSGARHATVEAVHVPGLLRIRVSDDGRGGASMEAGGGLRGLADRIRTVDGRIDISSPSGGPTAVTVELPSHA
jgi:signal transduction histidine kinase